METLQRTDSFDFGPKEEPVPVHTATDFPFLRADHSFDASTLQADQERDPSSICLSFSEGDVVFVHWVHDLGWGDVTLLHTGKRGWTPINYFSPCTDVKAIPLLSAAANFISQPKSYRIFSYDDGSVQHSFSQAAINEVVAGVRSLLDLSGTLSRESPVAQRSQAIRRHRKALLTELAYLVSVAKQHKKSTDDAVIDRLVRGCFRIVNKAVALLDVWHQEANSSPPSPYSAKKEEVSVERSTTSSKRPDLRIDEVSTTLCDYLGIFVHRLSSLGSDPTASVQILANTRHCMLACRELLVVVEAISASTSPRNKELERLKDAMFVHTRHLVHAARTLVASLNKPHDEVKKVAENLSGVARECSRLACECSVWCHNVLKLPEQDGDQIHIPNGQTTTTTTTTTSTTSSVATAELTEKSSNKSLGAPIDTTEAVGTGHNRTQSQSGSNHKQQHQRLASTSIPVLEPPPALESSPTRDPLSRDASCESSKSASSRPSSLFSQEKSSDESLDLDARPQLPNADSVPQSPAATARSRSYSASTNGSPSSRHSPQNSIQSDLENANPELLFKGEKVVAGTIPALVLWLATPNTPEFSTHVFLLCFRLFSTPREVAQSIVDQGCTELAVKWIESYWKPEDAAALEVLKTIPNTFLLECIKQRSTLQSQSQLVNPPIMDRSFDSGSVLDLSKTRVASNSSASNSLATSANSSTTAVNSRRTSISRGMGMVRRVSHDDLRIMSNPWTLKFGSSANASDIGNKFLEFDPVDVAAQLYLLDWQVFGKIQPEELIDQRFAKGKRNLGLSPNVVELVCRSNHLSAFVGETVLGANLNVKTRRNVIRAWIRISSHLFELGNYNSLVTILSTLRSSSIVRLRKVWDSISPKKMQLVASLGRLAAPDRNFAELRAAIRTRAEGNKTCIPYIGLYLSDLTLLDEGNPKYRTHNGKSLINLDRYARACDIISRIQQFQRQPMPEVALNQSLNAWLKKEMTKSHDALADDADGQWRRSCIIEPPN